MINYKIKNNNLITNGFSPISDYLRSLGITNVNSFLNTPAEDDELCPFGLDGMEEMINNLHLEFEKGSNFFLQVDSDVDGITSSSIFYNYFKKIYPNASINWRMHTGKQHGVILDTVPENTDVVVLPDSGSMQIKEQIALYEKGIKVFILDHHERTSTYPLENVFIINNQSSTYFTNKSLSGAGVVLKCIQAYDKVYGYEHSSDYYDLAALGILADMMDTRDLDNNFIIRKGLQKINNKMFQSFLLAQEYSVSSTVKPTKIDVVFYVAPLINGMIRAGEQADKEMMFRAFINDYDDKTPMVTNTKGGEKVETFCQYVARLCVNTRSRQNSRKLKCVEQIITKIEDNNLNLNQILVVPVGTRDGIELPPNITGLVATELVNRYHKPVLVLRENLDGTLLQGSGRGLQAEGFNSLLEVVGHNPASTFAEGHAMAFGTAIKSAELDTFLQTTNEELSHLDFSSTATLVDAVFGSDNISIPCLIDYARHKDLYGMGIPEPIIVIKGRVLRSQMLVMGKDLSSIKFNICGVDCVKFKDKPLATEVDGCAYADVTVLGTCNLNEWMGRTTPQLMIKEIDIECHHTASLF